MSDAFYHIDDENLESQLEMLSPEVLAGVDKALKWQLEKGSQYIKNLYNFFNDSKKPVSPREFLYFWRSLSEKERDSIKLRGQF